MSEAAGDLFRNDLLWGRPVLSYNVAAMATPALGQGTAALVAALEQAAGGPGLLHLTPSEALHVSLYAVAPVRESFDKQQYWNAVQPQVHAIVEAWARSSPPVTLQFTQLRILPAAVVAVAEHDDAVWRLRQQLAEALTPPPTGAPRYDMIHMTLARYAKAEDMPPDFATRASALRPNFHFRIEAVELIRERVYPALVCDRLVICPLLSGTAA